MTSSNDNNDVNLFWDINFMDWSLESINDWIKLFFDGKFVNEMMCQALLDKYETNTKVSKEQFIEKLSSRKGCGHKICRNLCDAQCITARNIKYRCLKANPILEKYLNFESMKTKILEHFFYKLEYNTQQEVKKYRIGVLALYLEPVTGEDEFLMKERQIIINQLSSNFYIADYTLIHCRDLFKYIKDNIDCVVLILGSSYQNDTTLSENYQTLSKFPFLKIFVVCTEDVASNTEETEIKSSVEDYLRPSMPANKILYYDWLRNPEHFPTFIKKNVSFGTRVKIAFQSQFIFSKKSETVAE